MTSFVFLPHWHRMVSNVATGSLWVKSWVTQPTGNFWGVPTNIQVVEKLIRPNICFLLFPSKCPTIASPHKSRQRPNQMSQKPFLVRLKLMLALFPVLHPLKSLSVKTKEHDAVLELVTPNPNNSCCQEKFIYGNFPPSNKPIKVIVAKLELYPDQNF